MVLFYYYIFFVIYYLFFCVFESTRNLNMTPKMCLNREVFLIFYGINEIICRITYTMFLLINFPDYIPTHIIVRYKHLLRNLLCSYIKLFVRFYPLSEWPLSHAWPTFRRLVDRRSGRSWFNWIPWIFVDV